MGEKSTDLHPLDPCGAEELSRAVAILRDQRKLSERAFFSRVTRLQTNFMRSML